MLEKRTNVGLSFPVWNVLEIHAAVRIRGKGSIKSLGMRPSEKTLSPSVDGTWLREAWGCGRPIIHKPASFHYRIVANHPETWWLRTIDFFSLSHFCAFTGQFLSRFPLRSLISWVHLGPR